MLDVSYEWLIVIYKNRYIVLYLAVRTPYTIMSIFVLNSLKNINATQGIKKVV